MNKHLLALSMPLCGSCMYLEEADRKAIHYLWSPDTYIANYAATYMESK